MENKIDPSGQTEPEVDQRAQPAEATEAPGSGALPAKEAKISRPPTARRERIRAYQKIDYWQ